MGIAVGWTDPVHQEADRVAHTAAAFRSAHASLGILDAPASRPRRQAMGDDKDVPNNDTYITRPTFGTKFKPMEVRKVIESVVVAELSGVSYNPEEKIVEKTKRLSNQIKNKLKEDLELPRYKYVVQVVIAEQKGQGIKMGCRSFWDTETDNYAEYTYQNDTLICVASAFGVYYY